MTTDNMKYFLEEKVKRRQAISALKPAVFAALKEAGITRVQVDFDGEGDSGQVETPVGYNGESIVALPSGSLAQDIETLCYDCLDAEHGGWEINDGAYGEFEFDVAGETINLDCNIRFTDTTSFSHEF